MDQEATSHLVALQLWTIREAIEADADRALGEVKAAGFAAVELGPLPLGLTPVGLHSCLSRHDLSVLSIHVDLPTAANLAGIVELAEACRCDRVIWSGWPRDPRFDSLDGLDALIRACNQAGAIVRKAGLQFGMHNHWWEFEPLEGVLPIRRIHEALDPAIFWQLDVYWAQVAGFHPVNALGELGSRVGSIHWKDGPAVHGEPMTVLGRGKVDLPAIAQALTGPVDWVIELDECATDRLEAARESLGYLRFLGAGSYR